MKELVSSKAVRILNILEKTYFTNRYLIDDITLLNHCSKATVKADL